MLFLKLWKYWFCPRLAGTFPTITVCLQRAVPLGYYVVPAVREFDPAHHHEPAYHHESGGVSPDSALMLHDQTPKDKFVRRTVFQSCPRVTFLGPDPTRRNVDPTRPDPRLPTKSLTRPDLRLDPSPPYVHSLIE